MDAIALSTLAREGTAVPRPSAGWSNETVLVTLAWHEEGPRARGAHRGAASDARADVPGVRPRGAGAGVGGVARTAGIPVPTLVAFEPDPDWLGAPFLVMAHVPGTAVGEAPGLDPWMVESSFASARVQDQFLATLATIHRVDWQTPHLDAVLRGGAATLVDEVEAWVEYAHWAAGGAPARGLVDALAWCRASVPAHEPPASLLWGDARLGNVMFDEDVMSPRCSIGSSRRSVRRRWISRGISRSTS